MSVVLNPGLSGDERVPCERQSFGCEGWAATIATYSYTDYDRAVPEDLRVTGAYCPVCRREMEAQPSSHFLGNIQYQSTTVWVSFE